MTDEPARKRIGRPPLTSRDSIITEALAIGYPDLTVGAVTRAVGVKYSTFYRHFPTLSALVTACVDHHLDRATWPDDGLPWRDHCHALGVALVRLGSEHTGIDRALLYLPTEPARLRDEVRRAVHAVNAGRDLEPNTAWTLVESIRHHALMPAPRGSLFPAKRHAMITMTLNGAAASIALAPLAPLAPAGAPQ